MASSITITFGASTDVLIDTGLTVLINIGGSRILKRVEIFKASRTRSNYVEYPNPYTDDLVAENYSNAWNIDYQYYSGSSVLPATFSTRQVTIISQRDDWTFDSIVGDAIDNGSITYTIDN